MNEQERKVISASRRVDMVAGYPDELAKILNEKCPPERVHTLVLWTKNAHNILHHTLLNEQLKTYDHIYVHFSITGLGHSMLEPKVPDTETALAQLPGLIAFLQSPMRLRIRFDPIVHFRMPDGHEICNLDQFKEIASHISKLGIRDVTTSWVQLYRKVRNRLAKYGIEPIEISHDRWLQESEWMRKIAAEYGLRLHGCCVPGWPRSRCIDGFLLNELHPKGYKASTKRAKGQRPLCGCTESWDIGWYLKCIHGCRYCYANPLDYPLAEQVSARPSVFVK